MLRPNTIPPTRRAFLQGSAATGVGLSLASITAKSHAAVAGANDRIRIGVIGTGDRARRRLMPEFHQFEKNQNARIVALCDTWQVARNEAAALAQNWYGEEVRSFVDYQDLLALDDVDAVIIATPDHQHTRMLCDAVKAGKDAYCEKPVAMSVNELNEAFDTVRNSGRVIQIGTQLRSWPSFAGCKAFYGSGVLGRVTRIEQSRNYSEPYWVSRAKEVKEEDVDWKRFLFGRPWRPFDPKQYSAWYGYRDFTAGPLGNLMVHFIDLVHYMTGAKLPTSAVAHGGTYCFPDDPYNCPDCIHALFEYPEGFQVSYATNSSNANGSRMHVYGPAGMMDLSNWHKPTAIGSGAHERQKLAEEATLIPPIARDNHMLNWLKCLRTRQSPHADMLTAGYAHTAAVILADLAWTKGRKMIFDAAKRQMQPA